MFLWTRRMQFWRNQSKSSRSESEKEFKFLKVCKENFLAEDAPLDTDIFGNPAEFFFSQSQNKALNFQIFPKNNRSKCSPENQFWEYRFLSKIAVTELRASLVASQAAYGFLGIFKTSLLSHSWPTVDEKYLSETAPLVLQTFRKLKSSSRHFSSNSQEISFLLK